MTDYYLILGIDSGASMEEVKAAYRRRALELHPDRSGLDGEAFRAVQEAHDVLIDPEERAAHDRARRRARSSSRQRGTPVEPMVRGRVRPRPESFRSAPSGMTGGGRGWFGERDELESWLEGMFERLRSSFLGPSW